MNTVTIQGVNINLDNLAGTKNVAALKSTNIFVYLSDVEQAAAYQELFDKIPSSSKVPKSNPPATEAANAAPGA